MFMCRRCFLLLLLLDFTHSAMVVVVSTERNWDVLEWIQWQEDWMMIRC